MFEKNLEKKRKSSLKVVCEKITNQYDGFINYFTAANIRDKVYIYL